MLLGAVTGHEKQQKHDQQIRCVEILWKQLLQESADTAAGRRMPGRLFSGRRHRTGWLRRAHRRRRRGPWLRRRCLLSHGAAPERTIRLWNIAVIHDITWSVEIYRPGGPAWRWPALPSWLPAWRFPAFESAAGSGKAPGPAAMPAAPGRYRSAWPCPTRP